MPTTNDLGGKTTAGIDNAISDGLPPVVWMVIFIIVGLVGLRMLGVIDL
jgi:hypothetical protein